MDRREDFKKYLMDKISRYLIRNGVNIGYKFEEGHIKSTSTSTTFFITLDYERAKEEDDIDYESSKKIIDSFF